MPAFRISEAALDDIRGIDRYTQKRWGAAQRRLYLSRMDDSFQRLAENPKISSERTDFDPPVRIHRYERHLIVYRLERSGVLIVRVLIRTWMFPHTSQHKTIADSLHRSTAEIVLLLSETLLLAER